MTSASRPHLPLGASVPLLATYPVEAATAQSRRRPLTVKTGDQLIRSQGRPL